MRETIEYRDVMEHLISHFGDKGVLTQVEVATYCGRCERWVKSHLGVGRGGISLPVLARRLLELRK